MVFMGFYIGDLRFPPCYYSADQRDVDRPSDQASVVRQAVVGVAEAVFVR